MREITDNTINKQSMIDKYKEHFGASDQEDLKLFFAPGRVNIIGEHQDYNMGHVFPAAAQLGIYATVGERKDNTIRLYSENTKTEVIVNLEDIKEYEEKNSWANYPLGMFKYYHRNFNFNNGLNIYFNGNLPVGAGLSSSAAILVLTGYIIETILKRDAKDINLIELSKIAKEVEYNFVGVKVGIMDHFIIANGRKECGIVLNCANLEHRHVKLNFGEYKLLVLNTNKPRDLVSSEFNQRIKECKEAERIIREHHELIGLSLATNEDLSYIKDEKIRKRAKHALTENKRVLAFEQALNNQDIIAMGEIIKASHKSLKEDYEVSCFELDTLVAIAEENENCLASRMIGAGFGGCTIAFVKEAAIEEFKTEVKAKYEAKTNLKADIYDIEIGEGVRILK